MKAFPAEKSKNFKFNFTKLLFDVLPETNSQAYIERYNS